MSDPTPLDPGTDAPAAADDRSAAAVPADVAGSDAARTERASYARALNRGYGDAMGRGMELAATLLVMVGLGWLVDRMADTAPLFIIVFSVIGFAGTTVKLWLGYDLEMRKQEDGAIWNRKPGGAS